MCILITKERGAAFPSIEAITNSLNNNPDGFGMAWNENGEVKTYRTMSNKQAILIYRKITSKLNPEDTGMIIHSRIATHGGKRVSNCHCWKSFAGTPSEMAFAHNGILLIPNRDDMTDSETFLRDWFEPAYISGKWASATNMIYRFIGSSKFAFIDRHGEIKSFGKFIHENDGCDYSNTSYMRGNARFADPRNWTLL